MIGKTCEEVGIGRRTYYDWIEADPEFKKACDDVFYLVHDNMELELHNRIKDKETSAIIFYCKTKLKYRGYTEDPKFMNYITNVTTGKGAKEVSDADKALLDRYVQDQLKYLADNHAKDMPNVTIEAPNDDKIQHASDLKAIPSVETSPTQL